MPDGSQVKYLEEFSRFVESAEEQPLREELTRILERSQFVSHGNTGDDALVDDGQHEVESFTAKSPDSEIPAHEDGKEFEFLEDVNLDEIDFSEYGDLSEMMEPSMSVEIDESEEKIRV